MIETVRLRPAKPSDARAIGRIHVETWRTAYPGMVPDQTLLGMTVDGKASAWRRALSRLPTREVVLVAEDSEAGPVGFASAGPNRDPRLPFAGEVQTLYVLPDWQNRGIGRQLLLGCFARLVDQGLASAVIWVLADNPSRFFYERLGGRRAGERDERLWGALLHEVAYGWTSL
jgi:ribosomal protein S18 acetylase RimI-like enzyme